MGGGILDFLVKDEPKRQGSLVNPIKEELKKQDLWIKHLHTYSRDLHRYASEINESSIKHKKEIVSEINNIHKWISYLNESHNSIKQEVSSLKSDLNKSIRHDFELYHKTLEEYIRLKFEQERNLHDELKESISKELKDLRTRRIINEETAKPVKNIMQNDQVSELSNPEKDLLNLLFNENKPMTYEAIAKKLGKSLNSVRVYMNSLRSKKQIIDEFLAPNGTKVFSIKNSELVKTLFNIR